MGNLFEECIKLEPVVKVEVEQPELMLRKETKEYLIGMINKAMIIYTNGLGSNEVNKNIDNILNTKKVREGNGMKYEISLKKNVVYFVYKLGCTKNLISCYLRGKGRINEGVLSNLREYCLTDQKLGRIYMKNGNDIPSDIQNVIDRLDSILYRIKRVNEYEFDYRYYSVLDNIMFSLLLLIKEEGNYFFKKLGGENINNIVSFIQKYAMHYTSVAIGNISYN